VASGRFDPGPLSELTLFQGVPARELEEFAPLLHRRVFPAGATVITADQPGDAVYVISAGSVKVHVIRPDGAEVILAVLGPGEVVGKMSLADSLARSADVSTLEEWISLGTGHPLNGELTQTSLDASIMLVRFHLTR
jgi:CRP-like cAMP-binding protein